MSPSRRVARICTATAAATTTATTIAATTVGALLLVWIGACGRPASVPAEPVAPVAPPAVTVPAATPAPEPQPIGGGAGSPCPYLDRATVETMNGQRVASVRISSDRPHPACFFYRGDGREQLRTWIVVATPEVAGATVDAFAPVATSDLAELPGGWSGGAQPTSGGAVIAVARQGTVIVVTTNQHQTIRARRIAEQVIAALDL